MIKLNLTPQNKQEELILDYLQNNASETLADKHGRYIYRCLGMRISVAYDTSFAEIYLL